MHARPVAHVLSRNVSLACFPGPPSRSPVQSEESKELERNTNVRKLLASKKLVLVLDLDKTLVRANVSIAVLLMVACTKMIACTKPLLLLVGPLHQ